MGGRTFVFLYCVFVLVALVAAALFFLDDKLGFLIPSSIPDAAVAAAWAGALGGVAISFKGVFAHRVVDEDGGAKGGGQLPAGEDGTPPESGHEPWSNEWILWHVGRPFTGLIVGIFVFIALKAVYPSGEPSEATLAAAAFVLGTQESGFFEFVKKIGGVVVSTGSSSPAGTTGDGRSPEKR